MPSWNLLNRLREKIYLIIWDKKVPIMSFFKISSFLVSLLTIISIVIFYGYKHSPELDKAFYNILYFGFSFYFVKYIITLLFSYQLSKFIRKTWFEGSVLLIWIMNVFLYLFFNINLSHVILEYLTIPSLLDYSIVVIQLFFFIVVGVEVSKVGDFFSRLNFGPSAMMLFSFLILISIGTSLLMLPEMTHQGISFINALFTSTSACCVTGLATVDIASVFTFKGKIIILMLIQLGGINMISFATFFAFISRESSGLKYTSLMKNILDADKLSSTRSLLKDIIFFSFGIELLGSLLIFSYWQITNTSFSIEQSVFYSIFHSVSAFNNAGLTLWSDGLYDISMRHSYFIQTVIMFLIFFGGLGFFAMQDIFLPSNIRLRNKMKWKGLQLSTKIALYTSLALIAVGAVAFYVLEYDSSLARENTFSAMFASLFQSVSSRTAGFNTVNFSLVGQPALLFFIILMFIGASPGSTGGGIKTTTFYLLFKLAVATITGKKYIESKHHSISFSLIDKATTIFLFAISLIFVSTFLLTITEGDINFINLLFEEVSAFGTVGLSTGITENLSIPGKLILIVSMFVGRVGPLTLGIALSKKAITNRYRYASANIMVG